MKKYTVLLFLCLFNFSIVDAQQSIYYDALFLNEKIKVNSTNTIILTKDVMELLSSYYLPTDTITIDLLNKNEFFKGKFEASAANSSDNSHFSNKSIASSIGGLNIATVADGLAKFLVKRTKQELNAAFFTKFKEEISREEFKDLQTFFPQTYRALVAIGDDIYNYTAYLQTLRGCFDKDLANLSDNLPSIIDNHSTFFDLHPELKAILLSSFYISEELKNSQHPGVIIKNYPDSIWSKSDSGFQNSFKVVKLISESFKNTNSISDRYWITVKELENLYADTSFFYLYMGLLSQKSAQENIEFGGVGLATLLQKNMVFNYQVFINGMMRKAFVLDKKITDLNKIENDSLLLEKYYGFISSTIDLLKYSSAFEKIINSTTTLAVSIKIEKYFDAAQTSADLLIDVNRRSYSSALVNLHHILSIVFPTNVELTFNNKKKIDSDLLLNRVMKYGNFIVTISQANSSDEVEQAIEAISMPAGSSRVKRESLFNVSLNAYTGLFTGYEYIKGVDNGDFKLNTYGITAPVGISISRGHSIFFIGTGKKGWSKNKFGWSTSLFISAIDIGALAAFRFTNDSTEKVPNIQLKDIVSPGAFISIGIPKSPISVNIGYQVGPLLREVTQKTNSYDNSYSRLSIGLCVDIPILNFHTKTKE